MNLSVHRLNNMSQLDKYLEKDKINEYIEFKDKVFKALDKLEVGHFYNIPKQVPEDQQDLFIKICCLYILSHYKEYIFSDDYTLIENRGEYGR